MAVMAEVTDVYTKRNDRTECDMVTVELNGMSSRWFAKVGAYSVGQQVPVRVANGQLVRV